MAPVFRFAPSPNGLLHLGHACSALLNADLARRAGGRLLLRIEDIDVARCPPHLAQALLEDLAWLGLEWEEPVRRQSEHMSDYAAALDRLDRQGLLYRSAASRTEVGAAVATIEARTGVPWPRDPDGAPHHPRTHLPGDAGAGDGARPAALRLDMGKALALAPPLDWEEAGEGCIRADPAQWGDVVLARKDVPASYHIAVVADDALQGVTHVVRGRDLFAATALHRLLQHLLNLPAPAYHHHPLVRGAEGEKLSKSLASRSLRDVRADGITPADVRRLVGLK